MIKIGDTVKVLKSENVKPDHVGKTATVRDVFASQSGTYDFLLLEVYFDGKKEEVFLSSNFVEKIDYSEYFVSIEYRSNMVVAHYIKKSGDTMQEIATGHGHYLDTGDLAVIQAASWAVKRALDSLRGGEK